MPETAARYAGEIAAMNALLELNRSFNRLTIPHGFYTMPQVASAGLTESLEQAAGRDPEIRMYRMDSMDRSPMVGDTRGIVRIVASKPDGRVPGGHVCSFPATGILPPSVPAVSHHLSVHDLADRYPHIPDRRRGNPGMCPPVPESRSALRQISLVIHGILFFRNLTILL